MKKMDDDDARRVNALFLAFVDVAERRGEPVDAGFWAGLHLASVVAVDAGRSKERFLEQCAKSFDSAMQSRLALGMS